MNRDLLETNPCLYRAILSCKVGRDALEGKSVIPGVPASDYALFNLLHAVQEIAEHLVEVTPESRPAKKGNR